LILDWRREMNMAYKIEKVTVLGLGTLGAQIAAQSAASGYRVSAYDPDEGVFNRSMEAFLAIDPSKARPSPIKVSQWPEAAKKINMHSSLERAVKEADLVVEVVPENLDLKLRVWKEMDESAPDHAILATNSSSMPVSKLEGATRRPERCLNIHFYQMTLGQNMADVMGGTVTRPEVLEAGREFVRSLGIIALKVNKEILGFCFNRVWRAVKRETLHMWADGYVDFMDVDRAWMIFNGTPWGPFGLMDAVGLDVIHDIEMVYYSESRDPKDHPPKAMKELVEAGRLGVKTGQGFYRYPDPEYTGPDFLKP
jgi:3-hydroxybutyryl-CoA dehydrogenase